MPLNKNNLITELRKFMDTDYSGFENFPKDDNEAIELLANAVYLYSKDVIPVSTPADSLDAKSKMISALNGMNEFGMGATTIVNALLVYAQILGLGMAKIGFSQLTPPPNPILPELQSIKAEDEKTAEDAANELSNKIHTWFTSWIAINPSTGVSQAWT